MAGRLIGAGDGDGAVARCALCSAEAVGPCARCRVPVCGDCCTLSEGGATTWAICLRCERRGGANLRHAWLGLLGWLALIVLAMAALTSLLLLASR